MERSANAQEPWVNWRSEASPAEVAAMAPSEIRAADELQRAWEAGRIRPFDRWESEEPDEQVIDRLRRGSDGVLRRVSRWFLRTPRHDGAVDGGGEVGAIGSDALFIR